MLVQAFLAVELLVADVAKVLVVLALVPQDVLVQGLAVLHLLRAVGTGDLGRHLRVIGLVGQNRLFGLEEFRAHLADDTPPPPSPPNGRVCA